MALPAALVLPVTGLGRIVEWRASSTRSAATAQLPYTSLSQAATVVRAAPSIAQGNFDESDWVGGKLTCCKPCTHQTFGWNPPELSPGSVYWPSQGKVRVGSGGNRALLHDKV